jgi:CRISPR-associated endonuclease Csn1
MSKKILGLDIGSNSIGWALLEMGEDTPGRLIDIGSRIFIKAVEDKTPTPKNVKRRDARLARRVIQRRARRKQRMLNYLVKLHLLPADLKDHPQPEIILNELGDPYQLRAKALDEKLTPFQVGRVLLHLVQRRGFLSNRKTLIGDMADDPDVIAVLAELEEEDEASSDSGAEEGDFKKDIAALRDSIKEKNCRTLGEYLARLDTHTCKRNRSHNGGHIRTDRQMYREELDLIWECQSSYHEALTADVREQIDQIIFFQRPLKLRSDRIGKCSLEPKRKRIKIAHPAYQRFRYLQDVNNLSYFDPYSEKHVSLNDDQRQKLVEHFESKPSITVPQLKKLLGIDRTVELNLERGNKKLKGNITICGIKDALTEWESLSELKKSGIIEDLLTIKKKSVLKKRLIEHWQIDTDRAIDMCFLEFEPGHGSLSLKAINKLLPHLEAGMLYSEARVAAGYGYEVTEIEVTDKLGQPPEIANPIVNKALHELRRLVNAIISEYGKIDVFRVEMARDLEMNTKRYKAFLKQQRDNTSANDEALEKYRDIAARTPELKLSTYPSRNDKIRYRLWKDQEERCAYSGKMIPLSALFTAEIDVDHIIPYSQSLDDSYMNKVVCYAPENKYKGQRTPRDAFGGSEEKWNQITQSIRRWDKKLSSKRDRFYKTEAEISERDFIGSQLNDTRYIAKVALEYLQQLGADITTTKGAITAWLRHQWGLDDLIGNSVEKDRVDHRHHTIDAVVTACVDRSFYNSLVGAAKNHERSHPELRMRDLHVDPPWGSLRDNLKDKLENMIVSHAPQRKLAGALHEETGVGFIEGIGNVTRKTLASDFTQVEKIYDDAVREAVTEHLAKYGGNAKNAFAEGVTVYHKDGKTPIKRVRIVQSKTTFTRLERTKLAVKNSSGEIFKWHAYGNIHHIAILKHKVTGKFSGRLVTVLEAARRARGMNQEPGGIYQLSEKNEFEFIATVHISDLVEISINDRKHIYRVRKLGGLSEGDNPRITLNYHADAQSEMHEVTDSISNLMDKYALKVIRVNALGKVIG